MNPEYFAIGVIIIMAIGFVTEVVPVSVTAILACMSFAITGIISFPTAFSGFSSDTIMLIAGSMIVGNTLARTGCTQRMGKAIMKIVGPRERLALAVFMIMGGVISMFISNSGTMAMLLPVMRSAAASSGGAIRTKNLALPVGIAVLLGGSSTLVGSAPQLVSQAYLESNGLRPMALFDPGICGIPELIFAILFFTFLGHRFFLRETSHIIDRHFENSESNDQPRSKMIISLIILACMVAGFVAHIWTIGAVAVLCGAACIAFRCIPAKEAYKNIDWSSIIVIASCFGLSKGLAASGGAARIANTIIQLLGSNANPYVFLFSIAIFYFILANMMSHTALLALSLPLFVPLAGHFHIDPSLLVRAMTWFVCASMLSPLGAASYSMTMTEGYSFASYIRLGFIPNLVFFAIVIAVVAIQL